MGWELKAAQDLAFAYAISFTANPFLYRLSVEYISRQQKTKHIKNVNNLYVFVCAYYYCGKKEFLCTSTLHPQLFYVSSIPKA